MEYHSAIKKNDIMPFAATWMDLEGITLNEVGQMEKDKYRIISSIRNKQNKQTRQRYHKKRKLQANITDEHRCKSP